MFCQHFGVLRSQFVKIFISVYQLNFFQVLGKKFPKFWSFEVQIFQILDYSGQHLSTV